MNRRLTALIAVLAISLTVSAQRFTISGYVSDAASGEKLIGATIYLRERTAGTVTNAYGFYSLTLTNEDAHELLVSYIGYQTAHFTISSQGTDQQFNIRLQPSKQLKEVQVSSKKAEAIHEQTQMSAVEIPMAQVKSLPALMGEADVMKVVQLLPGVQAGNEGSGSLIVRGGTPDQNLVLLDGVPVYNAYHLFGLFSVFNADALNGLEVIKGGFPARYGGRLSSVIDIRMKEGNKQEFHGEGGVGLIASRLLLEGPIVKDKASFMISGRRTYYDIVVSPFLKEADPTMNFVLNFYDLNGKLNYKISDRDHIYLSAYMGNDKFGLNTSEDGTAFKAGLRWGNVTAVGRWNHVFNPRLFGNLTAHYTRYKLTVYSEVDAKQSAQGNFRLDYFSSVRDMAFKYDIDYIPAANHYIKIGAGATYHTFKPGAQQFKINTSLTSEDKGVLLNNFVDAWEGDAYAEDDFKISSRLKANLGVHYSFFNVKSQTYHSLQPRASARFLLGETWSAKASYAYMTQYVHLLSNSGVGLPTDLWVPSTDRVKPQTAHQVAIGVAHTYKEMAEVSIEGFYKPMKNVIEYKNGASFSLAGSDWESQVIQGDGLAYGGEFFIQKKTGKTTGMLSYTLSWSTRYFDDLNYGKPFPYKYDRRHDLKLALTHKLTDRIELSGEWVFGTGNAISVPTAKYYGGYVSAGNANQPYQGIDYLYPSRNNFRMQPYHRLDLGVRFSKPTRWGSRDWVISVYNVYNRRNPFFIYSQERDDRTIYRQVSLFGIIPSISYQFKF